MITTLSAEQMLTLWRMVQGFEPLRDDAVITRTDGINIDRLLEVRMRAWYLNLLDTAPLHQVPVENIVTGLVPRPQPDGSMVISINADVRRVVEVRLSHWERPGRIVGFDDPEAARLVRQQASPYARAGASDPVVVLETPRDLHLYPGSTTGISISSLKVVVPPADGSYTLDEALLATIPMVNPLV